MSSAMRKVVGGFLMLALPVLVVAAQVPGAPISGTVGATEDTGAAESAPAVQDGAPDLRTQAMQLGYEDIQEQQALERLRKDFALKSEQLAGLKLDKELAELRADVGVTNNQADVPELIGLYRLPKRQWAEFLVGSAVLAAGVEEWVTSEWRVKRLLQNGVELANRAGEERTVLFGKRTVTRGAGAAAPTAPQIPTYAGSMQ